MPNFRIMEIDIDDVPWEGRSGHASTGHPEWRTDRADPAPVWGADINEEAVRAHPPKNPHP